MEHSMDHIDNRHAGRPADAAPDADNNLGRGAPHDREERIQQKRRNEIRSIERDPQYRSRRSRSGKPGIRLKPSSPIRD